MDKDVKPIGFELYDIYDGLTGECMGYDILLHDYSGIAFKCDENGKVTWIASFMNGKQHGFERKYTKKGFIDSKYINDELKSEICYDENLKPIKCN
jgi:hypothetical protein